jgi:hypothetical protein
MEIIVKSPENRNNNAISVACRVDSEVDSLDSGNTHPAAAICHGVMRDATYHRAASSMLMGMCNRFALRGKAA